MNGTNRQPDLDCADSPSQQDPCGGDWNQTGPYARGPWPPYAQAQPQYPQAGYQPYNPYYYQTQYALPKGMAIASLVLGLLALFLAPFITGALAVILGGVSIGRCNRGEAAGKGMAIAGVIIGIISIVGWLALIAAFGPEMASFGGK